MRNPLASKKAAEVLIAIQTIVGQVKSEFQGDVTRKIRLGVVSRLHGDSAWEISGGKVRDWARTKGFNVASTAGGDLSNNSRVGILKRMGRTMLLCNGLPNSSELWPLAVSHAAFFHKWRAKLFSRIKDPPNDSFAPRAREGFFVGVSSERSKTILVLRRSDGVVELEPVSSYVETGCVDPKFEEEKEKLDVPEDGFCNVMCDDDYQQEDQFFECNENNESDDFDVNAAPMTFHSVMKDAGATVVSARDVEKSSGASREEWRSAIPSLREHDVYQEVAEDERWTVPSDKIIPGNSVFTIKCEGTKKVRVDGGGNFQEYNGLAVFTVNVNVITVRVVMLIAGVLGRFSTRIYVNTACLHASLDGQEEVYVRPPPLLWRWGFAVRGALWRLRKALKGLRSAQRLWGLTRDGVLAALVMCLQGREYVLRQSCADLALWIIVWLGAETGLLFLMIRVRQSAALWVMFSHMSDDMLAAGDIPILHLFVDALKKGWEITQSKIIGPGKEGEIT